MDPPVQDAIFAFWIVAVAPLGRLNDNMAATVRDCYDVFPTHRRPQRIEKDAMSGVGGCGYIRRMRVKSGAVARASTGVWLGGSVGFLWV